MSPLIKLCSFCLVALVSLKPKELTFGYDNLQSRSEILEITEATVSQGILTLRWSPNNYGQLGLNLTLVCGQRINLLKDEILDDGDYSVVVGDIFRTAGQDHRETCRLKVHLVRWLNPGQSTRSSLKIEKSVWLPLYPADGSNE